MNRRIKKALKTTEDVATGTKDQLLLSANTQALIGLAELQQTANELALAALLHQTTGEDPTRRALDRFEREVKG